MTRRGLWGTGLLAARSLSAPANYRVGITCNTVGGWEKDWELAFREAREAGYRWVESFNQFFVSYYDKPEELRRKLDTIGVGLITISNGGGMETRFEDPSRHEKLYEDHLRLVRFIRQFGCKHLKINMGRRRPEGTTDEDLKHMAAAASELGRRITGEGLKFAVHAHMWNQFENLREIDFIMQNTDPQHVWFVLDTGHITMAGIDPVALARRLGHRIVEFHLKDVKAEHRGGARFRLERPDVMKDPPFFPLGSGGVDFPSLKAHLDGIGWRGWLTVELDSSPYRPPKESARMSREYIEKTLHLEL
jgi:sugar phosphate isomerase/epimerase